MLNINEFQKMMVSAADKVISVEEELTDIDSRFGDGDHGIAMTKIMQKVKQTCNDSDENFKEFLDSVSMAIMSVNGGSSVPLWTTLLEGMSEGAPEKCEVSVPEFQAFFKQGLDTLAALSKANVGDKTMMDTLIPAVDALCAATGDICDIMLNAKDAAIAGSKASEGFVSKFGRAKSYKEQTIGTPDAGAVSMKYFFVGLYEAVGQ